MAATMQVDIVSAEAEIWSGQATMLFAPSENGEIGILPRHAPLLAKLLPGEVRVQAEGSDEQFFYVSGGLIEVQPHVVTVLSDTALRAADLDESAAKEAQEKAETALADTTAEVEYAKARAELAQAAAQLQAIQRLRRRKS